MTKDITFRMDSPEQLKIQGQAYDQGRELHILHNNLTGEVVLSLGPKIKIARKERTPKP